MTVTFHPWLPGSGFAKQVSDAGYRLIFSTSSVWYLDWLNTSWGTMYETGLTTGVHQESYEHLVLGREICMVGETMDISDVLQTIWPWAAAISERLRPTKEGATTDDEATDRYVQFKCLLNFRGVAAAPFNYEESRMEPVGPGSCN